MEQPVYLRNTLAVPVLVPLAAGGARFLPACATTRLDGPTARLGPVQAALAAELLVVVALPPPDGVWRSLAGLTLRSPVSAPLRHLLAFRIGLEAQVRQRMALERQIAATRNLERKQRQSWMQARLELEEWRLTKGLNRAIVFYGALRHAAVMAGLPSRQLFDLLDGDRPLPGALAQQLNGHAADFLMSAGSGERSGPDGTYRSIRRYQRRCFTARRLVMAAREASGQADLSRAATWLVSGACLV